MSPLLYKTSQRAVLVERGGELGSVYIAFSAHVQSEVFLFLFYLYAFFLSSVGDRPVEPLSTRSRPISLIFLFAPLVLDDTPSLAAYILVTQ